MEVDIYLKEKYGRGLEVRIPWLPDKINFESGGTVRATYDIMNRGPVEVPTGSGLKKYSWESIFPGAKRPDSMKRGSSLLLPVWYDARLEEWRKEHTILTLMVTGYPINIDVTLDNYTGKAEGAFGDIAYTVSFTEHRDITIECTSDQQNAPKRQTATPTSYTVVSGDNLWKIAQNKLGKGSRHKEIYNLNKDIIETTAKKRGYKSSNQGHWIFPGTVLALPQ